MNKMKKNSFVAAALLMAGVASTIQAQTVDNFTGGNKNYISTGMPILLISPDGVSSAMGDAGVASTPDANSTHWNNAKFAFVDNKMALTTTYTPWLRNLGVSDMNFLYLAGYYRINKRSTVASSLTYFSLGNIPSTDDEGNSRGDFKPNEFAFDVTYSMKLSDNLSLGATGRFIHSDLTNGMDVGTSTTQPANALAADVGLYYQSEMHNRQQYAFGAHISNLGNKMRYSDDDAESEFLPSNLRLGGRYTYEYNEYNKVSIMMDVNKLLVPTPPTSDTTVKQFYSSYTDYRNTGSIAGVFNSFHDAPGGLKEELQEFSLAIGAEYWYANTFAVRAGYFYENENKGGRKYITVGAGIRYNAFDIDFSYLIPTTNFSQNPLANTIRITLGVNFGAQDKKS
jgi:hypothetical protein